MVLNQKIKHRLDKFREECQTAVESAKTSYISNLGSKLHDKNTQPKAYWKIINRVLNKSRAPRIPPIFHGETFAIKCAEKARIFMDFFSKQCRLLVNDSILPEFNFITNKRLTNIPIENDVILKLIRNLDPNKAAGSDGISGHMLLLCDDSIVIPLKIIFQNISIYPDEWKLANVTPVFKKEDKQLL